MIRFVVGANRTVIPDLAERMPGRGIWLSGDRTVIETPLARDALARSISRAAGGPVMIPSDLRERLDVALRERVTELLGRARRACQTVAEPRKLYAWLSEGNVALLLEAEDCDDAEARRLIEGVTEKGRAAMAQTAWPLQSGLTLSVLARVFDRERVSHVALRSGRLADLVRRELQRLAVIRCGHRPAVQPTRVGSRRNGRVHDARQ